LRKSSSNPWSICQDRSDAVQAPVDVVVRAVLDALEEAPLDPEGLGQGRVELAPVVVADEADGVGVVAEELAELRVADVDVEGGRVDRRPEEEGDVAPRGVPVARGELPGEAEGVREIERRVDAGGARVAACDEPVGGQEPDGRVLEDVRLQPEDGEVGRPGAGFRVRLRLGGERRELEAARFAVDLGPAVDVADAP
jgi:hypothetical protein